MSPGAIPFHPLADLFPLIEGAELAALERDIQSNNLLQPIWLWNGAILDGRNRYRALCRINGRTLSAAELLENLLAKDVSDQPVDKLMEKVVALNVSRRHLNESQRALIAARMAKAGRGRPSREHVAGSMTARRAAALMSVSERMVDMARALIRGAPADVVHDVSTGRLSVHRALGGLRRVGSTAEADPRRGGPAGEFARQIEAFGVSVKVAERVAAKAFAKQCAFVLLGCNGGAVFSRVLPDAASALMHFPGGFTLVPTGLGGDA